MNHGKGNSPWPDGNVAILRRLWAEGLSASQIAKQMNKAPISAGVTRNAVIAKIHRLGLSGRASPSRPSKRPARETAPRPKISRAPRLNPAAPVALHPPARGPNSVRFIARQTDQCPMFCAGEEGPDGFVCGEKVAFASSWCASCRSLVWSGRKAAETVAA